MPARIRILHEDVEPLHTGHVTRLALQLFDALHAAAGLTSSARPVLEAAATLHDAAFARCPATHPRAAADLVLRQGIPGLAPLEQRMAATAIRLHSAGWSKELARSPPAGMRPADLERALRIAAFLRVADALDHSHLQDATIRAIRVSPAQIKVDVRCSAYAGSAQHANQKADLWNQFCPVPIAFSVPAPRPGTELFHGVLSAQHTADVASRRALLYLYRLVADARQAVVNGSPPEALHDLRVAIRRHRTALRFFRPRLATEPARRIDRKLASLQRRLGPHRDAEVCLDFLTAQLPGGSALRRLHAASATRRRRLAALLQTKTTCSLLQQMATLARVETNARRRGSFAAYAARRARRVLRKIVAHGPLSPDTTPESAHAFRKLVRRGRYYAEMGEPALGDSISRLARRLKKLADALGDAHDIDVIAPQINDSFENSSGLLETLARRRRRAWAGQRRAWRRLTCRHLQKTVGSCLHKGETR